MKDGPTLTPVGTPTGAGFLAARRIRARRIIAPRGFAADSITRAHAEYPQLLVSTPTSHSALTLPFYAVEGKVRIIGE